MTSCKMLKGEEYTTEESNTTTSMEELQVIIKHIPVKRLFDIVFSSVVLLIGFPLFAAVALAIKLTSPGKIFYVQERIGRGGKPFFCYKFRTMYPDAEIRLEELLKSDPGIRQEWETGFKLKNDPRVTPVGLFLRKSSLDELPQFWNVLRGELSVVGPRPVIKREIEHYYREKAAVILQVRPGLTGLWQISGRSDTSYDRRTALDIQYVQKRSFLFDLKIIAKTIPTMIFSKGAY